MTTDDLLNKLYKDPTELEKMAQERFAVQNALATLDKVAEAAELDLSQMSPDEKIQLYNFLVQELAAQEQAETQTPAAAVPQAQVPAQTPSTPPVATPAGTNEPQLSEEHQQKIAENLYFSEMFGKNAARHYWSELQTLQKMAEEEAKEEVKEDKPAEGTSPTFEAMAREKAMKMKEEQEKSAAFNALLTKRAQELLASGKV